jgi:hypothetical protein
MSPNTEKNKAHYAMALVVIVALGFPSFMHLAAVACVDSKTLADILYKKGRHKFTLKSSIIRTYKVLYDEWQKRKFGFSDSEFMMCKNWLNELRERLIRQAVIRRPNQRVSASEMKSKYHLKRRDKRDMQRIQELKKALKEFE